MLARGAMDLINQIAVTIQRTLWIKSLLIPAIMCLALAVIWGRRDELSRNAILNTVTTVVIWGINIVVLLLCWKQVTGAVRSAYDWLGIPMLPQDIWDGVPLLATTAIAFAARDFADYWNHRAMHTRWLWPTHAAHHSDTHVNAFTTSRIHFLEAVVMMGSHVLLLTWMQLPELVPVIAILSTLHNAYVHMDLPWTHGPLRLVIASPVFHRWHHADTPEAYGKNLANAIPLWDWLFGTYVEPREYDGPMGATASGVPDTNPFAIWVLPFVQWYRMIRLRLRRARRALTSLRDRRAEAALAAASSDDQKWIARP